MAALKLPRFRRLDTERLSLKERAKSLAATTARILHFPIKHAPDAALLDLGAELERVQALRDAFAASGSNGDDPHFDRHWDVREEIDRTPARTTAGLKVKARAAALALRYDQDAEMRGPGSYIGLSLSLFRDLGVEA